MLIAEYYLEDAQVRLENLSKNIKRIANKEVEEDVRTTQFSTELEKVKRAVNDLDNALIEYRAITSNGSYSRAIVTELSQQLRELIKIIKDAENREGMYAVANEINAFLELIEARKEYLTRDSIDLNKTDIQFYSSNRTRKFAVYTNRQIGKAFELNEQPLRVLDVAPAYDSTLGIMKDVIPNATLYAVNYSSAMPKDNYDRVALGTMRGSTISNEVFDVLYLTPEIRYSNNDSTFLVKKEKDTLKDSIKYLRPGGALVLIMPYYRFYRDIATFLAQHFENFQVASLDDHNAVMVMATKRTLRTKELPQEDYKKIRSIRHNKLPILEEIELEHVKLPNIELELKIFRGSVLNEDELQDNIQHSGCMESFWKEQMDSGENQDEQAPLLPFTIGQIGLVLTSGCLDGVIDEGDGHKHVVKGRVIKRVSTERTTDDKSVTYEETSSNHIEINVILPDGTHKSLA